MTKMDLRLLKKITILIYNMFTSYQIYVCLLKTHMITLFVMFLVEIGINDTEFKFP